MKTAWVRRFALMSGVVTSLIAYPIGDAIASIGPFESPEVYAIAVDPGNGNTIYAGTEDGVYKTIDGGLTWFWSSDGIQNEVYSNLVIDPRDSAVLYVGTTDGLYKTVDAGQFWFPINEGLWNRTIKYISFDPHYYPIMYVGTFNGLHRSWDGGATWPRVTSLPDTGVLAIANDRSNPGTIYLGTNRYGILKTTAYGDRWFDVGFPSITTTVAVDPNDSQVVVAGILGGYEGIYRTADGGGSWTQVLATSFGVNRILFDPNNPGVVYAGVSYEGGVYKSIDGGVTWFSASKGLTNLWVYDFAFDPKDSNIVYAATYGGGIFVSYDGGATWN